MLVYLIEQESNERMVLDEKCKLQDRRLAQEAVGDERRLSLQASFFAAHSYFVNR